MLAEDLVLRDDRGGCTTVDVCLVATVAAGEPFFTASWKLEEGTVPTLASPPLVDPETVVFDR